MGVETRAVAGKRTSHSQEIRDSYVADFCQALSRYAAGGNGFSFLSSDDDQGRLVITFTIDDGYALTQACPNNYRMVHSAVASVLLKT